MDRCMRYLVYATDATVVSTSWLSQGHLLFSFGMLQLYPAWYMMIAQTRCSLGQTRKSRLLPTLILAKAQFSARERTKRR